MVVRPIIWWGSLLETAGADQDQPLTKLIYLVLSHRSRERVHSAFTTWNTAKSVGNVTAARSIHTLNSTELLSLLTKCLVWLHLFCGWLKITIWLVVIWMNSKFQCNYWNCCCCYSTQNKEVSWLHYLSVSFIMTFEISLFIQSTNEIKL